jgi:hypothetical protein
MNLALTLCLLGALPGADPNLDNFSFQSGTLAGWEGKGFTLAPAGRHGPSLDWAACSADGGPKGKTALLHRSFVIPPGAGVVRCTAFVVRGKDCEPDDNLDVVLFAAGKRLLPKQVRAGTDWEPVAHVLPAENGRPREYVWHVADYAGQTLRLALIDEDRRRNCFLVCGGLRLIPAEEFDGREFARTMHRLTVQHKLAPAERYESKHFLAYSNADEDFTTVRLNNCELIYDLFLDHFYKKGFRVRAPATKMMVAIFDSQAGFEAYVGQRMPEMVTGLYHPRSNRLLVYDYGQNRAFVDVKQQSRVVAKRIGSDLDRRRFIDTVNRQMAEFRTEANIGTVMHEVAHQLSFNCGLLNRDGDVPFWVAEGLATYCESTDNGAWQGIGEPNPERLMPLAAQIRGHGPFIPLRDLVENDGWMKDARLALLAYAQSWALFSMLMEERPAQMRAYLTMLHGRRTNDHRLDDFAEAFGADLNRIELRWQEYMKEQVERHSHARR